MSPIGVFLACLCLRAGAASADDLRAGVTVGTRHDDSSTEGAASEGWNGWLAPFAGWARRGPTADIELEARRRFDSTPEQRTLRPAVDLAKLAIDSRRQGLVKWGLSGRYQHSRDLLTIDPNIVAFTGETETGDLAADLGMGRIDGDWQMHSRSRNTPGLSDGWYQNATTTVHPLRTATTSWLVRGGFRNWTLDDREALRVVRATSGYHRQHWEGFSTEAELGIAHWDNYQTGTHDTGPAWAATATGFARLVGLSLDSKLRVSHDLSTTGALDLGRDVNGMALNLHGARSLEAEGGVFASPVIKDFAAVSLADTIGGDWRGEIEISHAETRLRDGGGPRIETSRASLTVAHRIAWVTAQTTLAYLRQVETEGPQVDRFRRGRVELALTAAFQ